MRTKLKVCVETRYFILSRGYREQDGVIVDPFDEMKRASMMVQDLIAIGIVVAADLDRLVGSCSFRGGVPVLSDEATDRFASDVRSRFHAWSDSPQERSIFDKVVPSIRQVCLEDAVASCVHHLHAERDVFLRHRRGGHPRYLATAARLFSHYQRTFFAMFGDRALDYVNLEIAGWKRAVRWYREDGVQRDAARSFAPAYSGALALEDGGGDVVGSSDVDTDSSV